MKFAMRAAIVMLSFSAVASAQAPIDGQWTGEMQVEGVAKAVTLTLTTDGDKLTGSITTLNNEVGIQDGTIAGADLAFKAVQRVGESEQKIACTGTVLAGEIQVSCAPDGGAALEFVVRRAAN
jgi:hypothetical protein